MNHPPWSTSSRQVQGRKSEKKNIEARGGRVHPMSGAGSIKADGSDEQHLYEHKDANKSYTMKAQEIEDLARTAYRQGLDPVFIVQFNDPRIRIICTVETDAGPTESG